MNTKTSHALSRLPGGLAALVLGTCLALPASAEFYVEARALAMQSGEWVSNNNTFSFKDDNALAPGVEIGFRNIGGTGFGAGVSYARVEFDQEAYGNRVLNPTTISPVTRLGNLETEMNLWGLTTHYEWETITNAKPYVGIFLGRADMDHTSRGFTFTDGTTSLSDDQFAYGAEAGFRILMGRSAYMGLQTSWYRVDETNLIAASITLGYDF